MIHIVYNQVFLHAFVFCIDEKKLTPAKLYNHIKKKNFKIDKKEVDKLFEEKKRWHSHATTYLLDGISIVMFYKWNNDASDHGTISHEIFHCVDFMLRDRQIKLSKKSDEVYAYCIGHLTRELYNKMWKK